MAEEKETEKVVEIKLKKENELRFEVEGKEKVTIEVCINSIWWVSLYEINDISTFLFSLNLVWQKYLEQN